MRNNIEIQQKQNLMLKNAIVRFKHFTINGNEFLSEVLILRFGSVTVRILTTTFDIRQLICQPVVIVN